MTLEVKGIVSGYTREVPILKGVDLVAREGLVTVIIGPNGAGKSTLLRTIYGYLHPSAGEVTHFGRSIKGLEPEAMLREGIAYLLQAHSVFPGMTVEENLELGGWTFRKDRRGIEESKERIYSHYPVLAHRRQVNAGALSGGEQRMLEIARILMPDPTVVLLDEPSAGLAPKVAREVYGEVGRLKDLGKTVMLVDQNINQAV